MVKSKHYINQNGEQVDYTLTVDQRPNLRDWTRYMLHSVGKNHLEQMFDTCEVDPSVTEFSLEFPERWANIIELRALPIRMLKCFPNLTRVSIHTHSVYIVQSTHSEHIRIISHPDPYPEGDPEDLSRRYCPPNRPFTGIMVASSKGVSLLDT